MTVFYLILPAFVWAAQLPPEIQADRYLLRAERQIEERDFTGAKESLDRVLELQREHEVEISEEFSLRYAQVSLGLGLHSEAIESATRYLTLAGRDGKHYRAALELLDKAEAEMAAVAAARNRLEEKRKRLREAIAGMEFVQIPPGEFLMGRPGYHLAGPRTEPVTRVAISRKFEFGKHEVTQAEWEVVMGSNPSHFAGCMNCPVENVSWNDVQQFVKQFNRVSETYFDGAEYRLPTEAEWEYAARAGTQTDTYVGNLNLEEPGSAHTQDRIPALDRISWYPANSGRRTHPVGQKEPNPWGLHDMLGNVSEWVEDWIDDYPGGYVEDRLVNRKSAFYRAERTNRGGDFVNGRCLVWTRSSDEETDRYFARGFRLVRIVP